MNLRKQFKKVDESAELQVFWSYLIQYQNKQKKVTVNQ